MKVEIKLQDLLPFCTLYPSESWIVAFGYVSDLNLIEKQIRKIDKTKALVKEIVVPEWIQTRLTEKGIVYVKKPIFSSYLFLNMTTLKNPEWLELEELAGINRILSKTYKDKETKLQKQKPFTLSFNEVAHVIRLSTQTLLLSQRQKKNSLLGKTVTVIAGPFSDLTGIVTDEKDTTVKVELAVLHRALPVEIQKKMVTIINAKWRDLVLEEARRRVTE